MENDDSNLNEDLEKPKVENLAKKQAILEELKEIIASEDSLKKIYDNFRALQDRWKEIGPVPATENPRLWNDYHFLVEKFFDKVRDGRELRDIDLEKNYKAKIDLCEKAEELIKEEPKEKALKKLKKLHEEWKSIGPVPKDKKEAIWERFKAASDTINRKERTSIIKEKREHKMKLLYDGKWFIGAIEFFDEEKGFGFIATSDNRYRDNSYYINESSFAQKESRNEHDVVVFQVASQGKDREKAVNVRLITNDEEDCKLALQYYPNKGEIRFKRIGETNIFSHISIPRLILIEHVISIIEMEPERTPQTTLEHFRVLVELKWRLPSNYNSTSWFHYGRPPKIEYLFDRDYSGENREAWEKLFSILTTDESIVLLQAYPTACKYFADEQILEQWLKIAFDKVCTPDRIKEINDCVLYLPESTQPFAKRLIQEVVDGQILSILNESSKNPNIEEKQIEKKLEPYKAFTSKTYEKEIVECVANSRICKLQKAQSDYEQDPINVRFLEAYLNAFFALGNDCVELKNNVISVLKNSQTVYPYLLNVSKGYDFFTIDESYIRVSEIVSKWSFKDIETFVKTPIIPSKAPRFSEIIFDKIFQHIGNYKISENFYDGKTEKWMHYDDDNCLFLHKLYRLLQNECQIQQWNEYIKTRDAEEILTLYHYSDREYDYITKDGVNTLIDAISLDWVYSDQTRWYEPPRLKEDIISDICVENGYDMFSMIARRLSLLDLNDNANITLAVLLTEMLSMDKPDKDENDYYEIKDWENDFNKHLWELRNSNMNNPILLTLLWVVHSKTPANINVLSDIMPSLPPYLQIRCVKKLFQLIAQGKIHHTAESLYNTFKNGNKPLCLPLEIAFSYLKLREKDPNATLTNEIMLRLLDGRDDHNEWIGIRKMVNSCDGRIFVRSERDDRRKSWGNDYYNGEVKMSSGSLVLFNPSKMIDSSGRETKYNNKYFATLSELIGITFDPSEYKVNNVSGGVKYVFKPHKEIELYSLARTFNLSYDGVDDVYFENERSSEQMFCECRLSDKLDNYYSMPFNWCGNKPCFCKPLRYHVGSEWEDYTILDFMRILNIPVDYTNSIGKKTRYGYYIILSSYLLSFAKFYEHLKCRGCGQLMKPKYITNYTYMAVNQFSCVNEDCNEYGTTVYLSHCFNKAKCNATIDSRDSKTCPNGQYICPECGACCSTENFRLRLYNLQKTGGIIKKGLVAFVENDLGHWEKEEYYCYKCGNLMKSKECQKCGISYNKNK